MNKEPAVQSTYKDIETSLAGITEESAREELCPYGMCKQQIPFLTTIAMSSHYCGVRLQNSQVSDIQPLLTKDE